MERILFQTGLIEPQGSLVALNAAQLRMQENRSTGLVEISVGLKRQIILVFANGNQTGAYLLEDGQQRVFNISELATLWGGAPFSISTAILPDRAGRAAWLVLESRKQDQAEVQNEEAWVNQLNAWEQENFNGVFEILSQNYQGFGVLQMGKIVTEETAFIHPQGVDRKLPPYIGQNEAWKVITYAPVPSSNAWRCRNLRSCAIQWAEGTLNRYESIAGQRFLEVTSKEIGMLLEPWQWKISLNRDHVTDEHFFTSPESTAHAYRAMFMGMGTQMNFVIGSSLTLRIMTEVYNELKEAQRAVLSMHRLIPAAFST